MKLSDTRFIRIDGTHVELMATNDDEARTALAELRHKKKELLHWKRRLRRRRAALERNDRHIQKGGTSPHLSPLGYVGRALGAVVHWLSGWNPFPGGLGLPRTLDGVAQDLNTLDEVQQNVEAAMLHIEGRLGCERLRIDHPHWLLHHPTAFCPAG